MQIEITLLQNMASTSEASNAAADGYLRHTGTGLANMNHAYT